MEVIKSVCRAKKRMGGFEFRIEGFSDLSYKLVTESVVSPLFTLNGQIWELQCYPNGVNEESKSFVGLTLKNNSEFDQIAEYSFSILHHPTNIFQQLFTGAQRCFKPTGSALLPGEFNCWGRFSLIEIDKLTGPNATEHGFCVNDTVVFKVVVKVVGGKDLECEAIAQSKTGAVSALPIRLWDLMNDGTLCDCTLTVTEGEADAPTVKSFPCHKLILVAQSPVFTAMFTHSMSESNTNEIVISDFSPEVIREMLHFMYTETLATSTADVSVCSDLLKVAIKYEVSNLVTIIESNLLSNLSEENVLKTFALAEACGSHTLREGALGYIKLHAYRLVNLPQFPAILESLAGGEESGKHAEECMIM